jgi:hypothetical protein
MGDNDGLDDGNCEYQEIEVAPQQLEWEADCPSERSLGDTVAILV